MRMSPSHRLVAGEKIVLSSHHHAAQMFYEAVGFKPYSMEMEILVPETSAPPGSQ